MVETILYQEWKKLSMTGFWNFLSMYFRRDFDTLGRENIQYFIGIPDSLNLIGYPDSTDCDSLSQSYAGKCSIAYYDFFFIFH